MVTNIKKSLEDIISIMLILNLDEIDTFFKKQSLAKLTQREIDNLVLYLVN